MGDIAEGILEGIFDEQTGEYIDDDISRSGGSGYPRSMYAMTSTRNEVNGIKKYIKKFNIDINDVNKVISSYCKENIKKKVNRPINEKCLEIQKDFPKFASWMKSNYNK